MSKNKRDPKSSGFEDPIKCITTFSAQTLIEICTSGNEYQQAQISCLSAFDVTAKEFHFHRTCYWQSSKSFDPCNSDSETRKKCFDDLVSYIEDIVVNEGEVVCITSISKNLRKCSKRQRYGYSRDQSLLTESSTSEPFQRKKRLL